jgi:hypothetical protein
MIAEISAQLAAALDIAGRPVGLNNAIAGWSAATGEKFPATQDQLAATLREETPAGPLRSILRQRLARWDHTSDSGWTNGTSPNTEERRELIYELLDPSADLLAAMRELLRPHITDDRTIIIERGGWEPWYTGARRQERAFYWPRYAGYLEANRAWEPENVAALDEATGQIVERLADPTSDRIRSIKGLVVGHVQSGKTANLTGVIAKAADAGYRLIIVLSGMTDLLRNQTQRRIDKELIGKEILRPKEGDPEDEDLDYLQDAEWNEFITHGGMPSEMGAFDWIRLTGERWDYQRLRAGIESLKFGRIDPSKPFYAPENLAHAPAKIMVVKKQSQRLQGVLGDLGRIKRRLAEVPALIIDDESDQASINTARPARKEEQRRRTTINRRIVELLEALPRAQYVGYTATPFASVLINADDIADLFPRDFIISLRAPKNYMGPRAFHDLDGEPPGVADNPYVSHERAFVREIQDSDELHRNLPRALDFFVLSGALKLYRADRNVPGSFKHHTMLIHSSMRVADHQRLRALANELFDSAGYETPDGALRLENLLNTDLRPVSETVERELPFPPSWTELAQYVGTAIARIREGEGSVIEVNGTDASEDPDFDKQPVWKVLVGGAKLSRGYTIEGLTVSYFRRRASAGDALMQMGRWFGYRDGYRDLVRLFISRHEQVGKRSYDLYEAFQATCLDEEKFREQLRRYVLDAEKGHPITPIQVPPLVYQHLDWLPPVAANKSFNARVTHENFGGEWEEKTMAPVEKDRIKHNSKLFACTLAACQLAPRTLSDGTHSFEAIVAELGPVVIRQVLGDYSWAEDNLPLSRLLDFLDGTGATDPGIDRWVLIAPQLKSPSRVPAWIAGDTEFSVKYRSRAATNGIRVKAYSEPLHRDIAKQIACASGSEPADDAVRALAGPGTAVMVFYPAHHIRQEDAVPDDLVPTMGFGLQFPANNISQRIALTVRRKKDEPLVDD